ncbi:putative ribonuclease H-like domain-containing protein [Tanacetum coccineum]
MKGILRQFSVAGTPQQNGVAKRRNRTLIEAARTMLADSKLLTTFGQKQLILLAISSRKEQYLSKINILIHLWIPDPPYSHRSKSSHDDWIQTSSGDDGNSTVNVAGTNKVNVVGGKTSIELPFDQNMHGLEDYSIFDFSRDDEDDGAVADMNNLDTTIQVSPNPTTRIHKDHPLDQVIRDFQLATQIRKMSKNLEEHGFKEPKKVILALNDPRWIKAMQEELLQFKLQEVWTLVDLPNEKMAIGSKWVFRNKKDERGIIIRNKERLVAQGYTQEEGIDYDEVFALVARIAAIRLFLAYASFKDFVDLKIQTFLIEFTRLKKHCMDYIKFLELGMKPCQHICWTMGFKGGKLTRPYSLKGIKMSSMGELTFFLGLQVKQKKDGIFISQDKYVVEILKKFRFTEIKNASTPMETQKPLLKDEDGEEVDVHIYRYQVNLKVSHLHAVKRIFSLDRKSTTGGYQFIRCRLISWQCKKQTVVANFTTEVENGIEVNTGDSKLMLLGITYYC